MVANRKKGTKGWLLGALAGALLLRYGMGLITPFLLGGALALLAEPLAGKWERKLGGKRKVSAVASVSLTLLTAVGLLYLGGALAVRGLTRLAEGLPDLQGGMQALRSQLHSLVQRCPEGIQPALHRTVEEGFADGQALLGRATQMAAGAVATWVGKLSRWALQLGTAVLAGYMLSIRLPKIKKWLREKLPNASMALPSCKKAIAGWAKAQLKLMALCYAATWLGLYIIGIKGGYFIGLLVALVDAVPMLGTGTVLLPWALFAFLQGQTYQAVGLCLIFLTCLLLRSFLEPRLVGKQMDLDPLLCLVAIYLGFQIWGIIGMLLFPVVFAVGKNLWKELFKNNL